MPFLVGAIVVGTALQLYSSKKESDAKEAAAEQNAYAKNLQADELLERFFINKDLMSIEAKSFKGSQVSAIAKSGAAINANSLMVLEQTNRKLARQIEIDRNEAEFKASQLRMGADIDLQLGSDIRKASKFKQGSIFLSGAAQVAKANQ